MTSSGGPLRVATGRRWPPVVTVLLAVAVAAAYYAGARLGLSFAFANRNVTAVWPPTGIAVTSLLLFGTQVWPGIALGAFAANVANGLPAASAAGIAVGNTLAPICASVLLRRAIRFRNSLDRPSDMLGLLVGGLLCMLISATLGTTTLLLSGATTANEVSHTWLVWWMGDAMGVVVFAPILLVLAQPLRTNPLVARPLEAAAVLVLCAATVHLTFGSSVAYPYPVFLWVVWGALRFRQFGAALVILATAGIDTWHTVRGHGPFTGLSLTGNLITLQTFNATVALASMVLAAVTSERERAQQAAARSTAVLEERVIARTSELAAAEAAARSNEARLSEAQALAHIGSWHWDIPSDRVTWSDELYRIYGFEPDSFAANYARFLELVHPDDRDRVNRIVGRSLVTGEAFSVQHRTARPSGEVRWLEARGTVERDETGRAVAMTGTGQDVTDARQAEEALRRAYERELEAGRQLREADQLKDEFLATVSHELRTPLAAILGLTDVLRTSWESFDENERLDIIDRTARSSREMAGLIEQLLDFSRLQAGRVRLAPRRIELGPVVEEILRRSEHVTRGHPMTVWIPAELEVVADPQGLERVLGNLLSNAAKFSPPESPITLLATENGSVVEIAVRDQGPGISPEERVKIFESFYTGQSVTSRQGSGVGLAIVARYVELLGGKIEVDSRLGEGSTFRFTVPSVAREHPLE